MFKIDLVTKNSEKNIYYVVLVEEGPWEPDYTSELERLQERLFTCVDVITEGHLSKKFPETLNQDIIVRLDGYNIPKNETEEFFESFKSYISQYEEYQSGILNSEFISSLDFEFNHENS